MLKYVNKEALKEFVNFSEMKAELAEIYEGYIRRKFGENLPEGVRMPRNLEGVKLPEVTKEYIESMLIETGLEDLVPFADKILKQYKNEEKKEDKRRKKGGREGEERERKRKKERDKTKRGVAPRIRLSAIEEKEETEETEEMDKQPSSTHQVRKRHDKDA
eukprot:TRINITY_DN509_c0_g4_i2.p1 TRINITY_DN509_c0_g4~~TRINITY_DN509_c0_g4_i2.p1  ORF type:complete len:161 (+),score=65.58 TRINITY_DN509_c0_g4_i2:215-697(+)